MENRRFEVDKRNKMEMIICRNFAGDGKKNLRRYNEGGFLDLWKEEISANELQEMPEYVGNPYVGISNSDP